VGVVAVAALPVAWRIHQAITTSKWADTDAATAVMWAVGATVLFVAASAVLARRVLPLVKPLSGLALLAFTGLFWLAVIPPRAGEQAQTRFSTVAKDMETRQTHWRTARAAMDPALVTQIFGNGIGSFPQLFFSY